MGQNEKFKNLGNFPQYLGLKKRLNTSSAQPLTAYLDQQANHGIRGKGNDISSNKFVLYKIMFQDFRCSQPEANVLKLLYLARLISRILYHDLRLILNRNLLRIMNIGRTYLLGATKFISQNRIAKHRKGHSKSFFGKNCLCTYTNTGAHVQSTTVYTTPYYMHS